MLNFSTSEPVRDPALFVGRDAIRDELRSTQRSTLLIGEARIGKSSLLLQLKHDFLCLGEPTTAILPIYLDFGNPLLRRPEDVYDRIAAVLSESAPNRFIEPHRTKPRATVSSILGALDSLEVQGQRLLVILLIDNIERDSPYRKGRFDLYTGLRELIEHSPPSNRVVVVAAATNAFLSMEPPLLSRLLDRLHSHYLAPLSFEQASTLSDKYEPLRVHPDREVIQRFLFDQTGGHPCLLQLLLERLERRKVEHSRILDELRQFGDELRQDGLSFFQELLREVTVEELTLLQALALGCDIAEWDPDPQILRRFQTAGLLQNRHIEAGVGPDCHLFFAWLRSNARRLLQTTSSSLSQIQDSEDVVAMLARSLRAAVGGRETIVERELQEIVHAMLAAHELSARREAPLEYAGKKFYVDFSLPNLGMALETKVLKNSRRLGQMVDELLADAVAYSSVYKTIAFVIYDLSGSARPHAFHQLAETPYCRFLIVDHDPA